MADTLTNLPISAVATAPSPATSGTSLVVTASEGAFFPSTAFYATVCPAGTAPTRANAEIVRVTARSTDTMTITRASGAGTTARTIVVGDQFFQCLPAEYFVAFAEGPVSATDNAIARFDGTTGKLLQGYTSNAPTVGDTGDVTINGTLGLSTDVLLARDAANTLAQRNGVNAQTLRLYGTYTDSSNYERLAISTTPSNAYLSAESAGTGAAAMNIRVVPKAGGRLIVENATTTAGMTFSHVSTGRTGEVSYDSNLVFRNYYASGAMYFDSGTSTIFRTASGGTSLWTIQASGHITASTDNVSDFGDATHRPRNLYLGTALVSDATTGIKIGTATTQKIGFFNATPVVQGASVADATDATTVITQLNALISRIEALGLIATV